MPTPDSCFLYSCPFSLEQNCYFVKAIKPRDFGTRQQYHFAPFQLSKVAVIQEFAFG